MAGYIRRRGKDTWELTVDLGRDPATGRRRRRFLNVRGSKRDAERTLADAVHQRDTGVDINPGKLTVADYLRRWLRDYAAHNVGPSTQERYTSIVEHHLIPVLGALRLRDLRPAHIQAAYGRALAAGGRADGAAHGLSPRTVLKHHRLLRETLGHAVRWQLIARNPADAVTAPRPARFETRVLDAEEAGRLLEAAAETSNYALTYLALATGARLGELLALRWRDVDLDRGSLQITRTARRVTGIGITYSEPKTHRSRRPVALSSETVNVLREHRRVQVERRLELRRAYTDDGLVFASPTGQPLDGGNVRHALARIADEAGIPPLRFHDLRHSAATLMLLAGVHPKVVSERLGHATVGITL
ncbi:MAG: site-specific integrase, partial [Proteobacteria bacterium]|nr:site-specific integrase [Pseudomonadota bacterium]